MKIAEGHGRISQGIRFVKARRRLHLFDTVFGISVGILGVRGDARNVGDGIIHGIRIRCVEAIQVVDGVIRGVDAVGGVDEMVGDVDNRVIGACRMREKRRVKAALRTEEADAEVAFVVVVVVVEGGEGGRWRSRLFSQPRCGWKKMAEHFGAEVCRWIGR